MSDLISREALLEEIKRYQMDIVSKATAMKVIRNAPAVTDTNVGDKWISCSGCTNCQHKECKHHGKV